MRVMNTPKSMDISITNKCNLRCKYCSHFTSDGDKGKDLPTEQWLDFFEELNRCAVLNICIQGGEPFIRKDLKEIINGIVQNRMRFSILSNGTLITEEMAAFIAATGRCDSIQVSIDGSTSEVHDSFRGDGNFQKAVQGIKHLQKVNIPTTVRVTIHRHNVYDLDNIAHFLLEEVGLGGFSTNTASYFGLCREYADDVQLTVEERSVAMHSLINLKNKYNGRITATAGPLSEALMWTEMENARKQKKDQMPNRGYLKGCGGVFSKMAVCADGSMVPCTQMSHLKLGQIDKDNLKNVWQNHPELEHLRKRQDIALAEFEFCKDCPYTPYCTGNCPALAYTLTEKENHPSPDACLKRFLESGGRLPNA